MFFFLIFSLCSTCVCMFVSGKSCSKASLANCAHTDCWKWARTVMWYLVHSDWNESEWGFLRRCRSHGVTCAVFTLRGFWDMWKMDFSPPPTSNRQTDIYVPLLDRRSQISCKQHPPWFGIPQKWPKKSINILYIQK